MKFYKGFNHDMTCRDFQYKEGETYETDKAEMCKSGFHACKRPLDVFSYYSPVGSVYHEVTMDDFKEDEYKIDSKICGKKIAIGRKISFKDFIDAERKYAVEHHKCMKPCDISKRFGKFVESDTAKDVAITNNQGAAVSYDFGNSFAGDYSVSYSGYHGVALAGEHSISKAKQRGIAISKAYGTSISGRYGISIAAGTASAAVSGNNGMSFASQYASTGESGIIVLTGEQDIRYFKAGIGSVVVFRNKGKITTFKVDGTEYKPDTVYKIIIDDEDAEVKAEEATMLHGWDGKVFDDEHMKE